MTTDRDDHDVNERSPRRIVEETSSRPLWLTAVIAGVAAAALNLGIALVARAADVSLEA